MKTTALRNLIIPALGILFAAFNFAAADATDATAQTRGAVKPTATATAKTKPAPTAKPNAKNTPAPAAKVTVKPPVAAAPKTNAKSLGQIIVTATNVTIRQEATTKSPKLTSVRLGKIMPLVKKGGSFYQIEYENGKNGWIATTYTRDFDADRRESLYREIGDKYLNLKKFDYANAAEVTDFLRTSAAFVKTDQARAELSFKRLQFIAAALKAIPSGKGEQPPYKNFIRAIEKDSAYSEPSGEWFVNAASLWDLHGKYTALPIAEEIAWAAANTPIPGECEGYVNCDLYNIRATDGEYLNFYPNGKYTQKALTDIAGNLDPLVADIKAKTVYKSPTDISDRAEFNRFLTELRTIVSKVPNIEKNRVLKQIGDLGEGYK